MKFKLKLFATAFVLASFGLHGQTTQTVDLSTGVVNGTTTRIAPGSNDDTWLVMVPGGSSYVSVACANDLTAAWANDLSVRWLSTSVDASGNTGTAPSGDYLYKMTFNVTACPVTSSVLSLVHFGADNTLTNIKINTTNHAYSAGFTSLSSSTVTLGAGELVVGINTIIVTVHNSNSTLGSNTQSGFLINGYLTINYAADPYLIPSITGATVFCGGNALTFTGSDGASTAADHYWEIIESNSSGVPVTGGYVWYSWYSGTPGTFTFPVGASIPCNKYYKVKLAVQNPCVNWAEVSQVIFIKCEPSVNLTASKWSVCSGSPTVLTANGSGVAGATYTYNWYQTSPTAVTLALNAGNTITVSPTVTSTYSVTAVCSNGCSAGLTVPITALPTSYNLNLSTGYDNASSTVITPGSLDDEWYVVSIPSNANLNTLATDINYTIGGLPWALDPAGAGQWITSDAYGSDAHNHLFAASGHYIYETYFTLPSTYGNYTLTLTKFAADNDGSILLDGTTLVSLNPSAPSTNYTTGITSPVTVTLSAGSHVLRADIIEYDRYTGMFLQANVAGVCGGRNREFEIAPENADGAVINNTLSVYPNPGTGLYTLELGKEGKVNVEVYDALGKKVKSFEQTALTAVFDLTGFPKGIYIVNVISDGTKTSKKIILE
jgi:hypothetical protein